MTTVQSARPINYALELILVAVTTFILTYVSVGFFREFGRTATFWPANAVILSTMLRADRRRWLEVIAVGVCAMTAAYVMAPAVPWLGHSSIFSDVALPLCNAVNVLICAYGMRRAFGREIDLTRGQQLLMFLLLAGIAAPLVTAALSVLVMSASRHWNGLPSQPLSNFLNFYASRALGLTILTPVLLATTPKRLADVIATRREWRAAGLFGLLAACLAIAFLQNRYPLQFLIMPVLMLITFQLELAGGALAVLLTAIVAVSLSAISPGEPGVSSTSLTDRILLIQLFLAVNTMSVLVTAAILAHQRRLATASRESEARYRLLADRVTDVIIRYDLKGIVQYVSPSIRQFGYDPKDVVGRHTLDYIHPDDLPSRRNFAKALVKGDSLPQGELNQFRMRCADGSYVWLESSPSRIFDDAGAPVGVVAVQRDVSARRAMVDELRRKREEAEAASVAKAEFLANMSHEIRTPLTAVIGFAGLLQTMDGLTERARTYISRISTGGRTLLSIVDDILDFSKLEAGQVALNAQPFELRSFFQDTIELVRGEARAKGLELRIDVADALPAFVSADSGRLRQVLLNLLNNAIKFTDRGHITVAVRYSDEDGCRLRAEVSDTGMGISPDHLARLFQRFSQVDGSMSRQYGGSGLGLAICKGLVEQMGGEIGVDSRLGDGSTFWFTIAAPQVQPLASAPIEPEEDADLEARKILVVDDAPMNRELVSAILSPFGLVLTEAANGAEAVEAARHTAFDLIVMDLQMPVMDGYAATRAIRAGSPLNRDTPILALSANVLSAQIEACAEAGMNDHIAKPIKAEELLSKIARWIEPADDPDKAERSRA